MNKNALIQKISAQLSRLYSSEDNPIEINTIIGEDEAFGLSTNEMPLVKSVFHDYECIVWANIEGVGEPIELNDSMFSESDLRSILNSLMIYE